MRCRLGLLFVRHRADNRLGQRYTRPRLKEVSQAKESASTHMAKTTATKMATAARIDLKVFRD